MLASIIGRRDLLRGAVTAGAALTAARFGFWPQQALADDAKTYPMADLLAPTPLPDIWMGPANAPVTLIEYASMTCTHCAAFHKDTYPVLKSKYIDTGKVRFVLREFPLDPLAAAAFMLARSVGPEKRNALVDLMFDQQQNWAFVPKPVEALASTVRQAGITQSQFETTLKDQKLYDQVNQERDEAAKKFGVNATPTFYVNGTMRPGEMSVEDLDKVLQPLLPKG